MHNDPMFLPGMLPAPSVLFDERRRPDFRDVFGMLASRSTGIATAVTRVRLSTIDLTADELAGVSDFRVLVAELNALSLDTEARVLSRLPNRADALGDLERRLESGRLEVRSAPLGGWSPDFTVFYQSARPFAVLTGYHWFQRPYPHRGPALAAWHASEPARLAARRHHELWGGAHDVGPAVWGLLSRARVAAGLSLAPPAAEVPEPSLRAG